MCKILKLTILDVTFCLKFCASNAVDWDVLGGTWQCIKLMHSEDNISLLENAWKMDLDITTSHIILLAKIIRQCIKWQQNAYLCIVLKVDLPLLLNLSVFLKVCILGKWQNCIFRYAMREFTVQTIVFT